MDDARRPDESQPVGELDDEMPGETAPRPGTLARARLSLRILERLSALERPAATVTDDDRTLLALWCGWGPLARAFDPQADGGWALVGAAMREFVDDNAWDAALQATPTSFYTPPWLSKAIWQALLGLGFTSGHVLEPGCGHGTFMAAAPDHADIEWKGLERDPVSARIARVLHPAASITTGALETMPLREGEYEAAIGNVPFADIGIYDPTCPRRFTLHNYFLWRAVRALRPGGIAALVTSRFSLDADYQHARHELNELAQFLGAVRLPGGALSDSGTDVVADVLLLRRRRDGDEDGEPWLGSSTHDAGLIYNDYFAANPGHVIGEIEPGSGQYRADPLHVRFAGDAEQRSQAVSAALADIVRRAVRNGLTLPPPLAEVAPVDAADDQVESAARKQGSFHLVNGEIRQVVGRKLHAVRDSAELRALIRLRDATLELLTAEADIHAPDGALEPLRERANLHYDTYVQQFGPVNRCTIVEGPPDPETGMSVLQRRRPPMGGFRQDPDYVTVLALESYDDDTGDTSRAPLLRHRVNRPALPAQHADSPGEAIALTLDARGHLDLTYAAQLLGVEEDAAVGVLGDLVFHNPVAQRQEIAAEYLSGNVRGKLADARTAEQTDPEQYARNVTALEAVQPANLTPAQIRVRLGAPWVGADDVEAFITETLGQLSGGVTHVPAAALWEVDADGWERDRPVATTEWGTARIDAYRLVEMILNGRVPVVYDEVERDDGTTTKVRNVEETMLATEKARMLNDRFSEWVWEDPDRTDRLAERYNRLFNSTVLRSYDGSHLTFPGMAPDFTPYPSQKDIVYRIISSPAALCGFAVGAGKTAAMFMSALTMRRLGLAAKPMIVVPNHLLEQVARDGKSLFPLANILMAGHEDVTAERRRLFAARCAMGDWDAIVITHSAFTAMGVHPSTEASYLGDVLARYRCSLYLQRASRRSRSVKRVAKMVESMAQRQRQLLDHRTDVGVTFEQLGVDYVFVDESHYFKRLSTPCMTDGFNLEGSKRATDLAVKLRWLRGRNAGARWGSMFTGTPVSNTLAELFVIQTYQQPDRLAELELDAFDAWARNFVEFVTRVEVAPDGGSFRLHTRPSRFHNVPELRRLFAEVADIRTAETLNLPRPTAEYRTVVVPPAPEQEAFIATLVARAGAIRSGARRDGDNMLVICSDGRKAALDLELVGVTTAHPGKVESVVEQVLDIWRTVKCVPALARSTRTGEAPGEQTPRYGQISLFARSPVRGGGNTGLRLGGGGGALGRPVARAQAPQALQIVFCDQGTPRSDGNTQVYGKIRAGLVAGGMPGHLIRFVHDAATDTAKAMLFADCRAGKVAVLLGSTDKLGVGTNIQATCVAIHHVDAPWRPADIEQREGRGVRPGNRNPVVRILRYVTERSFDGYMWQALERKARFIAQILTGELASREVEDIGEVALTYAEVKALATGNPLLLEHAETQADVARLRQLAIAHERGRLRARRQIERFQQEATQHAARATLWKQIADAVAANATTLRRLSGDLVAPGTEAASLAAWLTAALAASARGRAAAPAGTWCGLELRVEAEPRWPARDAWLVLTDTEARASARIDIKAGWTEPDRQGHLARVLREAAHAASDRADGERNRERDCLRECTAAAALAESPFANAVALRHAEARLAEIDAAIQGAVSDPLAA
ncbi:MAG TPA: helicase-related protein [Candidatus Angelobacter sp.]|jgi:N12 class adenine-specific DNA methylase|nr:helicase-related protein [Candidatus Angelobacter sp.]